ncbi:hypothetical protein ISS37_02745 [candidate division KSB1 bacterium]|nr:hypothetical protein [candidate division KSB1 bacterium]
MSQYFPIPEVFGHPELGRCLYREEYDEVLEEFENLGFRYGWIQAPESQSHYQPDFARPDAFEYAQHL